jgi:prepilin-type processing-associated H-X9-DG protein
MAAMMFANDHHGSIPTCTQWYEPLADQVDPNHVRFVTQPVSIPLPNTKPMWLDFYSSLFPYLGVKSIVTVNGVTKVVPVLSYWLYPSLQVKVFRCPSDPSWDSPQPGYQIQNNVGNGSPLVLNGSTGTNPNYFPISYGVNGDIATVNERNSNQYYNNAVYGANDIVLDVWHPSPDTGKVYSSADCILSRVHHVESTMLFADCGIRPAQNGAVHFPQDDSDCLLYTTNTNNGSLPSGTLAATYTTNYLPPRIPLLRHKNRINISFCDGHAETVPFGGFDKVWISPWQPK